MYTGKFAHDWRTDLMPDVLTALHEAGVPATLTMVGDKVHPERDRPGWAAAMRSRLEADRPDFDWKNPNRFRSLIGGLAANHAAFHALDGSGYDFVADWLMRLDPVNPQTAARLSTVFETWPRYDADRRARARAALERLAALPSLSGNTGEMVRRILAAGT